MKKTQKNSSIFNRFSILYSDVQVRLSYYFSTAITFLRYWPLIEIARGCRFQRGVIFKPYLGSAGKLKLILSGSNIIGNNSVFQGSASIKFGMGSFCASNCVFSANNLISIGENVMIADAVSIRDTDHGYSELDVPMIKQPINTAPVYIENNVWIGHGVIILKGVSIGQGSIIGAGSVVTKNISKNCIVGGVPARLIRKRKV